MNIKRLHRRKGDQIASLGRDLSLVSCGSKGALLRVLLSSNATSAIGRSGGLFVQSRGRCSSKSEPHTPQNFVAL